MIYVLSGCASHWSAQAIEEELLALQAKVDPPKGANSSKSKKVNG